MFKKGVGYVVNKNRKNCTLYSMGEKMFDFDVDSTYTLQHLVDGLGFSIMMRDPQKFFYLDDSYYFVGQVNRV